jgi:hypothetical protein
MEGCTPDNEAMRYLCGWLDACAGLTVFAQRWPREYKRCQPLDSFAQLERAMNRLAELVNQHCFPVHGGEFWDEEESGWWNEILIDFYGRVPVFERDDLSVLEKLVVDERYSQWRENETYGERVARVCEHEAKPWQGFRHFVELVTCDTGNLWLDLTDEEVAGSEMPTWSLETVKFLTAEYRAAEKRIKQASRFERWVLARPSRLAYARMLLERTLEERTLARIRTRR